MTALTDAELTAQRDEAEAALHRLAKDAGVPDDGPDENVNAVLAKLRERDAEIKRMEGWLEKIEGGDYPCLDQSRLREWARRGRMSHDEPGEW